MKFLNSIDLGQNQLLNVRLQNLASDPSSPVEGQIWQNSGTHVLKWFNGSIVIEPLSRSNHTGTQSWTTLTATPTTIAGYGITDAVSSTSFTSGLALKAPLASPSFTGTPLSVTAAVDTNTTQIATTGFVIGQAYAKLASPTFTGTPVAPTAAGATNTTQIATTAFVRGEITALISAAPTALDTLNELAAALGNDANFSTTITTSLAAKAPLASPALAGVPTAPTATALTNTTQIATTAFVANAVSAAGSGVLRFNANVGDGTSTSIVVTHGLGTRDVHVSVAEASTPWNAVTVDWQATSTTTITLIFAAAPTSSQYRVSVLA